MTHVVIVDDDAGDLAILQRAFMSQQLSSQVTAHQSAEEAMAWMLSASDFDISASLIVTDLNMPRVDGFEFIRQLRQLPEPPPVIVVLSTSARQSEISRAYRDGANAYHTKPMGFRDTAHLCRGILHYWTQVAHLPNSSPNVRSLIYVSEALEPFDAAGIEDLGVRAQKANHIAEVTGYLLFSDGHFLQFLEGPPEGLEEIYQRIAVDNRHRIVRDINLGTARRRFPEWSMSAVEAEVVEWPPTPTVVANAMEALKSSEHSHRLPEAVSRLTHRMVAIHMARLD